MNLLKLWLLCLYILCLTACGGGSSNSGSGEASAETADTTATADSAPELERLIVVIGDSIGEGFGASFAFPDLLESRTGIRVINVSKGGSSAEFGASRAPDLIARFRPMFLVMLLGTNNAGGAGGGVSGAISSLRFAARVAIDAGVIPIIGTIPPISRDADENDNASAISSGIRGIRGARIARINRSVSIGDIDDGKHPNDRGQEIIANLFAQQVF